ncbi:25881_t:CDS:2, partial [Gigaspora margarita]
LEKTSSQKLQQITITLCNKVLSDHEQINIDFINALTTTNIPFEKVDNSYQLQDKYLLLVFIQAKQHLHQELNNQFISIMVDETTMYGINVVNVLFSFKNKTKLVKTSYLTKVNTFDVLFSLIPHLRHNGCLAHIYSLVDETWINYKSFKGLDSVVNNLKETFTYSSAHKRRWIEYLIRNKSVALYVISRIEQTQAFWKMEQLICLLVFK